MKSVYSNTAIIILSVLCVSLLIKDNIQLDHDKTEKNSLCDHDFQQYFKYRYGDNRPVDRKKALSYCEKSAASGNPYALFYLAEQYIFDRDTIPQKLDIQGQREHYAILNEKVLVHYKKAADLGLTEAQYQYGAAIINPMISHDDETIKEAGTYLKRAADKGHMAAQYKYGVLHDDFIGHEVDFEIAEKYFTMSADNGHVRAAASLAAEYSNKYGNFGFNLKKAQHYAKIAADLAKNLPESSTVHHNLKIAQSSIEKALAPRNN